MNEQASRFIGSIPQNYDNRLGPHIFNDYADRLAKQVAALNPDNVLELAAGTGIVTRRLRDALPGSCDLIASDLNSPMLDVAQDKFDRSENISFRTMNAQQLDVADNSVEVIACQFGVMFFPDRIASYREALRVLDAGGHYVFNVWGNWDDNPFARVAHETMADFFQDDPPGFYQVPFGYHDESLIRSELESAGFGNIVIESIAIESAIPSAEDFAQGLIYGNPAQEEILNRGGDPEKVCTAMARAIETRLGNRMPLQALFIDASMH